MGRRTSLLETAFFRLQASSVFPVHLIAGVIRNLETKIGPVISPPFLVRFFRCFQVPWRSSRGYQNFPQNYFWFPIIKGKILGLGHPNPPENGIWGQKWVITIPCPKVENDFLLAILQFFSLQLVSMGNLDLNNSDSSPEGSTEIGMLIEIGHKDLPAKFQRSGSTRFRAMRVESCHSFQWEKWSLRKSLY